MTHINTMFLGSGVDTAQSMDRVYSVSKIFMFMSIALTLRKSTGRDGKRTRIEVLAL